MDTLLESLGRIRETPLDEIIRADVDNIIAEVLRRDIENAVDVARFGSSI